MKKKILLLVIAILVLIQFIRPTKNISADAFQTDISKVYKVPGDVSDILKKACNDCHSNNTRYPWYAEIQPVAWWLNDHIEEGKEELNFSEFGGYSLRRQISKLRSIENSIKDGTMPLSTYTFMHKDAKLTKEEQAQLIDWVKTTRNSLTK